MVLAIGVSPAAATVNIAGNGGFELAGVGGAADSDQWTEVTSFIANLSERSTTNPNSGSFSHHLYAEGTDGLGTVAAITQHSANDSGFASLMEGTVLNASFDAMTPFGPGGVMNYSLRILNSAGAIVQIYSNTIPSPSAVYNTFTTPDLNVPAFGAAPNDAFYAFIEINAAAGGFLSSTAEVYVDNVMINGTVIPEPTSALLLVVGALGLRRRR
jgi:hypothetical protein